MLIPHKVKNKGKYISFHYLRGWKARKIRKVQEISPQIPICISVCFKNGQLRLELPTHLSLQNPTALPLPCFALLDFVVVTSGENKYSLCSCLFSCWCSKLCDFFFLALNFASIDVNRCFFSFLSNEVHPVYLLWKSWTAAMNESCLHERIHGYRAG